MWKFRPVPCGKFEDQYDRVKNPERASASSVAEVEPNEATAGRTCTAGWADFASLPALFANQYILEAGIRLVLLNHHGRLVDTQACSVLRVG